MNLELVIFILLSLAVWRLCSLFVYEDGPFEIFETLRNSLNEDSFFGKLLSCTWCLSMWIAACATISYLLMPFITTCLAMPFAFSAVACVLDEYLNKSIND